MNSATIALVFPRASATKYILGATKLLLMGLLLNLFKLRARRRTVQIFTPMYVILEIITNRTIFLILVSRRESELCFGEGEEHRKQGGGF